MIKLKNILENTDKTILSQATENFRQQLLKQYANEIEDLWFHIGPQGDVLHLSDIRIKKNARGQGIGSKIIDQLKKFADQNKLIITLSPEPERGYKAKLDRFYRSHGFVHNKGRKKDYRLSNFFGPTMVRRPMDEVEEEEIFKVGEDPNETSPSMPVNWNEPDIQMLRKWDEPTIREFLKLPKNYVAIYPAIIELSNLDAHVEDPDSEEGSYDYEEFRFSKRGYPPIVVRRTNGRLSILDGNHRVHWAQQWTKYTTIAAWVVDDDIQKHVQRKMKLKEADEDVDDYEIEDLQGKDAILQYLTAHGQSPEVVDLGGTEYIIWDDNIVDPEWPYVKDKDDWIYSTEGLRLIMRLKGMMEDKFNKNFWERPEVLFHATPRENVENIRKEGLKAMHKSRGFSNKNIHAAVFTSTSPEWITIHYGPVVVTIRTDLMKKDGFMPYVTKEPNHTEAEVIDFIAGKIKAWEPGTKDLSNAYSEGTTEDTVIVYASIPPKYLEITE